jgi:hypothetical protein
MIYQAWSYFTIAWKGRRGKTPGMVREYVLKVVKLSITK